MIADSQTTEALLEYICRHPAEDDARLVYADWLDDHDDPERAEFIRLQCELACGRVCRAAPTPCERCADCLRWHSLPAREQELYTRTGPDGLCNWYSWAQPLGADACKHGAVVFRRGFLAEVTLNARAFAGGPCGRCEGSGKVLRGLQGVDEDQWHEHDCPDCRGTGRAAGHAAALFRGAPIEKVTLSGKRPWPSRREDRFWWFAPSVPHNPPIRDWPDPSVCQVPSEIMDLLPPEGFMGQQSHRAWRAATEQAALNALAAAALLYGRRRGWPCQECKGRGALREYLAAGGETVQPYEQCPDCRGRGHTVTA